jgi:hypothetical protein
VRSKLLFFLLHSASIERRRRRRRRRMTMRFAGAQIFQYKSREAFDEIHIPCSKQENNVSSSSSTTASIRKAAS